MSRSLTYASVFFGVALFFVAAAFLVGAAFFAGVFAFVTRPDFVLLRAVLGSAAGAYY